MNTNPTEFWAKVNDPENVRKLNELAMSPEGAHTTPGHGAPRCPTCDGLIGKCDHMSHYPENYGEINI
ncbi:MAG TPA: hypothetical protein VKQ27_20220 [Acetobacteraceae bacterium]|nr:hypothetical protein [Acetobacteraceae bacterium]